MSWEDHLEGKKRWLLAAIFWALLFFAVVYFTDPVILLKTAADYGWPK